MKPEALKDLIDWAAKHGMRIKTMNEYRPWLSHGFTITVELFEPEAKGAK